MAAKPINVTSKINVVIKKKKLQMQDFGGNHNIIWTILQKLKTINEGN